PGRGPGRHRQRRPAHPAVPPARPALRGRDPLPRRRPGPGPAVERGRRHAPRGPPSVLQHAGPPQVPPQLGHRTGPDSGDVRAPHLPLRHNGKLLHEVPLSADLLDRVALLFGPEIHDRLYPVDAEGGPVLFHGYVADPACARGSSGLQYWFVNGRRRRGRGLTQALEEAYRGLLMTGRHPVAFLFLDLPTDAVDVNVHPSKAEVRFRDPAGLAELVLQAVRRRLQARDWTGPVA